MRTGAAKDAPVRGFWPPDLASVPACLLEHG